MTGYANAIVVVVVVVVDLAIHTISAKSRSPETRTVYRTTEVARCRVL